jgi:seryl-tRNA(Sec) selenium transferase
MPTASLPSFAVTLRGDATRIEARLRRHGIVARVEADRVWLDVRCVSKDDVSGIISAVLAAS